MKKILLLFFPPFLFITCSKDAKTIQPDVSTTDVQIEGTWKLISAQAIINSDTTYTNYTEGMEGIKIINDTHFSFFQHDLTMGKDSTAKFSSGGGRYVLQNNLYTEFLEYCNAREWENNTFDFTVEVRDDTLLQTGIEKVPSLGVDRIIIETYIRKIHD